MTQAIEFVAGLFLAYLIMSGRLRRLLLLALRADLELAKPKQEKPAPGTPGVVKSNRAGQLITDSETIRKWMNDNPDLKRANGG